MALADDVLAAIIYEWREGHHDELTDAFISNRERYPPLPLHSNPFPVQQLKPRRGEPRACVKYAARFVRGPVDRGFFFGRVTRRLCLCVPPWLATQLLTPSVALRSHAATMVREEPFSGGHHCDMFGANPPTNATF